MVAGCAGQEGGTLTGSAEYQGTGRDVLASGRGGATPSAGTGGTTSTGGTLGTGTGGVTSTGGTSETGGQSATGGRLATGGQSATGGAGRNRRCGRERAAAQAAPSQAIRVREVVVADLPAGEATPEEPAGPECRLRQAGDDHQQ